MIFPASHSILSLPTCPVRVVAHGAAPLKHFIILIRMQLRIFVCGRKKFSQIFQTGLKPGGILVYMTCSVFAEENERLALERAGTGLMKIEKEELIAGYLETADSMYAARFTKLR